MSLIQLSDYELKYDNTYKEQPTLHGYPAMKRMFNTNLSCEFEVSNPVVSSDLSQIIESQYQKPVSKIYAVIGKVPKRPHKKRRIRKKWGKKYGYWDIIICGDCNILSVDKEGIAEFTLRNIKHIVDKTVDAGQPHDYDVIIERR